MGKLTKERRDIYYRQAKKDGYRARSAYKLLHLADRFDLFKDVERVVDLCAAPGSWSQVTRNALYKVMRNDSKNVESSADWKPYKIGNAETGFGVDVKNREDESPPINEVDEGVSCTETKEWDRPLIVSVDLQEMSPIEGVTILKGDITDSHTINAISAHFNQQSADLILCDGAPDVTGMHDIDEYVQSQLLLSALNVCVQLLVRGGTFVAKVFRGENIAFLYTQLRVLFNNVYCCKPASSRNSSLEAFVVCRDFQLPLGLPEFIRSDTYRNLHLCGYTQETEHNELYGTQKKIIDCVVPFIACGDLKGWDADRNYTIDADDTFLQPVQPPIHAPYEEAIAQRRWNVN